MGNTTGKTTAKTSPNRSLGKLISSSDLPCFVLTSRRKILLANHALADLLSVSVDSLRKMDCSRSVTRDDTPNRLAAAILSAATLPHQMGVSIQPLNLQGPRAASADSASGNHICVCASLSAVPNSPVLCIVAPRSEFHKIAAAASKSTGSTLGERIEELLLELRRNYETLDSLSSLLGDSSLARRALDQVQVAVSTDENTVVHGIAGAEHDSVVQSILSGRKRRLQIADHQLNVVSVQCDLMDEPLLNNMLQLSRESLSAVASGEVSALVLKRIEQLSPEAHGELNRYLREISVAKTKPWIVATTTSEETPFDSVLNVVRVDLPSLAQRREDLGGICTNLLAELPAAAHRSIKIDSEAFELLQSYAWPGDMAELRAALKMAVSNCLKREGASNQKITRIDLPIAIQSFGSFVETEPRRLTPIDLDSVLADLERSLILAAMQQSGGNKAEAARLLSIQRSRLIRKLKQHEITEDEFASDLEAGVTIAEVDAALLPQRIIRPKSSTDKGGSDSSKPKSKKATTAESDGPDGDGDIADIDTADVDTADVDELQIDFKEVDE